jgi:cell division initiation protein
MMDLTPLEVRKKKGDFRRGLRGYDPPQVDDFLDIVADRMESLVRENQGFHDRLARLEQLVADYREREKALTEALVSAQEMREEMRAQSTREADLARRQAEQDATRILADAHKARDREEDTLRRLRARQMQFLQTYRAFLERELGELAPMANALELNDAMTEPMAAPPLAFPPPQPAPAAAVEPPPVSAAAPPPVYAASAVIEPVAPPPVRAVPPATASPFAPPAAPAAPRAAPPSRPPERTAFAAGVAGAGVRAHTPPRVEPPPAPPPIAQLKQPGPAAEAPWAAAPPEEAELILSDDDVLPESELANETDVMFGGETTAAGGPATRPDSDLFGPEFDVSPPAAVAPPDGFDLGFGQELSMPDVALPEPKPEPSKPAPPKPVPPAGGGRPPTVSSNNLGLDLVPEFQSFHDFGDLESLGGLNDSDFGLPDVSPQKPAPGQDAEPKRRDDSDDDPEDLLSSLFGDDR